MHPHEHVRATLRRGLVGGGRFTVVREPRSALSVALWPYSQVLHAFAISDRVSGPARFPGLEYGLRPAAPALGQHTRAVRRYVVGEPVRHQEAAAADRYQPHIGGRGFHPVDAVLQHAVHNTTAENRAEPAAD